MSVPNTQAPKPRLLTRWLIGWFGGLLRWLLWALAGLVLLGFTLLLVLRFYAIPHLGEWRPEIETYLSKYSALDVRIGDISLSSSALLPDIALSDVELRTPANQKTVLLASQVQASLSWKSLLQLAFSEFQIQNLEITVQRQSAAQWVVAGFPLNLDAPANPDIPDWFVANHSLQLHNATLHYLDNTRVLPSKKRLPLTFGAINFSMRNTRSQHHFELTFTPPADLGKPIQVQAYFNNSTLALHPGDWRHWSGNASFNSPYLDLAYLSQNFGLPVPIAKGSMQKTSAKVEITKGQWQQVSGKIQDLIFVPESTTAKKQKTSNLASVGKASLDFQVTPQQGEAKLKIKDGWINLPGILATPKIPLGTLNAHIQWTHKQDDWTVQANSIVLENTDLALSGKAGWRSQDTKALGKGGIVDIDLQLQRAKASKVYRYLPLNIPGRVRKYVQEALTGGEIEKTHIQIQGPVAKIPFPQGDSGRFDIEGVLRDARFVYIPRFLQDAHQKPWPALGQLSANFILNGAGIQVTQAQARIDTASSLQPLSWQASIPDFQKGRLHIQASTEGPLTTALQVVQTTPLGDLLEPVLKPVQAQKNARYQFELDIPLGHPENTQIGGEIHFLGSNIKVNPEVPWLRNLTGTLEFNRKGFGIHQARARVMGGPITLQARFQAPTHFTPPEFQISGQGRISIQGLRKTPELGSLTGLGTYLGGSTGYSFNMLWSQGVPEVHLESDLVGLSSSLPAPFTKAAEERMPLLYQSSKIEANKAARTLAATITPPLLDSITLRLGKGKNVIASVHYVRDLSNTPPHAIRGSIGIGLGADEAQPNPNQGVGANIQIPDLDLFAWLRVLRAIEQPTTDPLDKIAEKLTQVEDYIPPYLLSATEKSAKEQAILSFIPNSIALRSNLLRAGNYQLKNLVAGGVRTQNRWKINLTSDEMTGYLAYTQTPAIQDSKLYARLSRLHISRQSTRRITQLVEGGPEALPNTDIAVDDLRLDALSLGKLVFQANNVAGSTPASNASANNALVFNNYWKIEQIALLSQDARITGSGDWGIESKASSVQGGKKEKRTNVHFQIDATDLGGLFDRLDLPHTIAEGKGIMTGNLNWSDSPHRINYASLNGQIKLDLQNGRFLKIDPGSARLLSLLSLQFFPRLLALNSGNDLQEGFAFDSVRGTLNLKQGIASTTDLKISNNALANIDISGSTNMIDLTQSLRVVLAPQIDFSAAALAAAAINPVLLVLLPAQWLTSRILEQSSIQAYTVTGSWADPIVTKEEP